MDEFLFKYRFIIGGVLIAVVIVGVGIVWWDKASRAKANNENREVAELKQQNELLRQQLSEQAVKNVAGTSVPDVSDESDKVNINTASAEELDTLPNIGPARAADIIDYREENGGFKNIEEIKNIKGIGDKSFEDLKDLITVGDASEE